MYYIYICAYITHSTAVFICQFFMSWMDAPGGSRPMMPGSQQNGAPLYRWTVYFIQNHILKMDTPMVEETPIYTAYILGRFPGIYSNIGLIHARYLQFTVLKWLLTVEGCEILRQLMVNIPFYIGLQPSKVVQDFATIRAYVVAVLMWLSVFLLSHHVVISC